MKNTDASLDFATKYFEPGKKPQQNKQKNPNKTPKTYVITVVG